MTKNLLFVLATVGLIINVGGCTSKKSQDDSQVIENADVDKIEAEELSSPPQDPGATDDMSLQAALGESTDSAVATSDGSELNQSLDIPTESTASTDMAAAPTLDETSLNDVPQPSIADSTTTPPTDNNLDSSMAVADSTQETTPSVEVTPSTTETTMVESSSSSSVEASSSDVAATPATTAKSSGGTLKKIALTVPYQSKVGWVNTVYVARPGEKLKDISQTIYGSDKTKDLKKIAENSYLKSRSVKAGDKIYYVSPNRPEDSAKTLFYYEDMGMVPETYVAKKGDNLKKVAKEILGYNNAYVEMWTSNPVESKTKLSEGETLKYWRSASSINTASAAPTPAPTQGANLIDASQAPQNMAAHTEPPPQDMNSLPPPPDAQQMAANTAPPPDMNNSLPPPPNGSELPPPPTDAGMDSLPPPPPPPDLAPPPPPPMEAEAPVARKNAHRGDEETATTAGALDNDTMMSLGAVGVLTAALAFILIRRKKKKAADQAAMSETNVGT